MIEHSNVNVIKSESANKLDELLHVLDRVVLSDVKKAWTEYQSIRDRSAVYRYLHMVFMQVDWWHRKPDEMHQALHTIKKESSNIKLPDDMYAAVIMLTADPKKVDGKMRSTWSRVLQYAAEYKPEKELLRDFAILLVTHAATRAISMTCAAPSKAANRICAR
jgi:hypothetical protein